jgi:hypothetical protein
MSKLKLPSQRNLRKLLNESLPDLKQNHLQPILEIGDPTYYQQRAMEMIRSALNHPNMMKLKDENLKQAIALLLLARNAWQTPVSSTKRKTSGSTPSTEPTPAAGAS